MAIKNVITLVIILGILVTMSCAPKEDVSAILITTDSGKADIKSDNNIVAQVDNRFALLDSCSFYDALIEDWGFIVDIIPLSLDQAFYLGGIVKKDGKWIASYDSGFANTELISIEEIDSNIIRFTVEICKNKNPAEPFAAKTPDTPSYRFYVDLPEADFRAAVRRGIQENRQVVVIKLNAFNMDGEPVGEWFHNLSSGTE